MPQRHPVEIAVTPERALAISWNDGHETVIKIDALRDYCACATCRKARMDRTEEEEKPKRRSLHVLEAGEAVACRGANWDDGHRSIFTYEYLASLCPCDACTAERGGPPVPFDPIGGV